MMSRISLSIAIAALAAIAWPQAQPHRGELGFDDTPQLPGQKWRVHDIERPRPHVVTPGTPGQPPSDAIVLFDGKDLSHWQQRGKGRAGGQITAPRWKVQDGYLEVAGGTGDLISREKFGDAQFHVEWAAPVPVTGSSQARGNSGVLLMSFYEIQVLDCDHNPTYADGGAGAIYGQWPPLVNACRPAGEWQTYDIFWEAPRFESGKLAKPAYVTVVHNGVLLHHHQEVMGRMVYRKVATYAPHAEEEPLALQDHNQPVRYRNIWVRRLGRYDQP
jgi:3-keto-disaccharide hydrolase